ncbi:ChuX/HutX family heme-like substrate-binding protein [Hyphomicrobium sp. LHD-15]|uniref:ChuX/HutX family heme-like substrate-binding protein n=1 Tax=Hyphomicrobium sp. LHD-15 TaxID=3072142 RepID=UPI00280E1FD0|nr:ChuX/HutX family heme-like substrate-binding protein [Hyphomicrobium sp. LHD-15]MDQ8698129.1 ChuX/HutX family heme-like substrate-binding protein [Hyphomicrobium sp. LHD-15]
MAPSCRRANCPQAKASELHAFLTDPYFSGGMLAVSAPGAIAELPGFDHVVSVTRNSGAAMTSVGRYAPPSRAGDPLTACSTRTSLRMHAPSFGTVLAVERIPASRKPHSLHFFDQDGVMLHEAFLTSITDDLALEELTSGWNGAGDLAQDESEYPLPASKDWLPKPIAQSAGAHRDAGFHLDSILRDNGLARRASLPAWGAGHAWQVEVDVLFNLFTLLTDVRMPLVFGVGNVGLVQVHRGEVDGVKRFGTLMRISSKCCNVTLSLDDIEEIWVSRIESQGRIGHMLEIYDWRYHCVAQFKDCEESDETLSNFWRQLLMTLPRRQTHQSDHIR